jgi:hypothetical protein
MRPKEHKMIAVTPELHYRAKLVSARLGVTMMETVRRGLDLIEAQSELPHPADAEAVPVLYVERANDAR